jgi:predicted nucleic acid-binding protein
LANRVAFDTTFLIDFQRERIRGTLQGPAHGFLAAQPETELHLSTIALGEFAEGFEKADDPLLRIVRELHVLLHVDEQTALEYGRITRILREAGRLIGTNDLWIAAASLRHDLPLVTANPGELGRVPGLEVIPYR